MSECQARDVYGYAARTDPKNAAVVIPTDRQVLSSRPGYGQGLGDNDLARSESDGVGVGEVKVDSVSVNSIGDCLS